LYGAIPGGCKKKSEFLEKLPVASARVKKLSAKYTYQDVVTKNDTIKKVAKIFRQLDVNKGILILMWNSGNIKIHSTWVIPRNN